MAATLTYIVVVQLHKASPREHMRERWKKDERSNKSTFDNRNIHHFKVELTSMDKKMKIYRILVRVQLTCWCHGCIGKKRRSNSVIFPCIDHFQWTPSPLTSSLTLLAAVPAILDTEQLYTPASLSVRLLISSCELSVVLMTLLPSPRRNKIPSFSQRISGAGMPVKEHTSSKRSPSVWVGGAGRSTMVGRAVVRDIHMVYLCAASED